MLALVDGEPRVLNLKEMLTCYLEHQKEVVERRSRFDLNQGRRTASYRRKGYGLLYLGSTK